MMVLIGIKQKLMNKTSAEGVVFGEQSVLSFRQQPPSPFAAGCLPQCVCEQRGGQKRFAMNQQTQLQFNLQVPPNPANLATTFNPYNASPVVVEKVGPPNSSAVDHRSVPAGGFTMVSTDRLVLAMRLAKRDLLRSRVQQQQMSPSHQLSFSHEKPLLPQENGQSAQSAPPPMGYTHFHPRTESHTARHTHNTPYEATSSSKTADQSSILLEQEPLGHPLHDDDNNQRHGDKTSQEIVHLQKEIHKHITLLKNLKEKNRQSVSEIRTKGRGQSVRVWTGDSGRVWREEEEDADVREHRRKEEQSVRSARMVYNLSQQVESLQRDLNRLKMNSRQTNIRHTKKSQAMNKLAATHRAALRTLQSYHIQVDQPFSTELALLLQKLSLLSHQLEVRGSDEENDIVQQQLHELTAVQDGELDTQQHKNDYQPREHFQSKGKENSHQKVVKRIHFVSAKKPPSGSKVKNSSVLFDSRLQSQRKKTKRTTPPHFAKQTFSSIKRQQPLLPHTPAMHSTPFPASRDKQPKNETVQSKHSFKTPLHISIKHKPHTPEEISDHSPLAVSPGNISRTPSPQSGNDQDSVPLKSVVVVRRKVGNREAEKVNGLERITATLVEHNAQLDQLRTETRERLSEIQEQLVGSKVNAPSCAKSDQSRVDSAMGVDSNMEAKVLQSHSELLSLVQRIEELEGEEELIRQRWNTITYQDPLLSKPAILHVGSKQNEDSPSPPVVVPPLSVESLSSIEQYRERYSHYLQSTGMNTQGGFDPWRVSESLADELLSEAVEQVVTELDQLCENCVENLYSAEFAQPS